MQFLVFKYYFVGWLNYLFVRKPATALQLSAYNLFQSTFRIPESERKSNMLVFWKTLEMLKLFLFNSNPSGSIIHEPSPEGKSTYIYDLTDSAYVDRKNYVEFFAKEKIAGGIFKEELKYMEKRSQFWILFIFNIMWFPFLFIHNLFKADKAPIANLWKEQTETLNLIYLLKKNKVQVIYHFCIYEKDSNINTLLLQKLGIKVNKISSEVPLAVWNKIIVADELCLGSGYQYDELEHFKKSIFVNQVNFFGPEECLSNIGKYSVPVTIAKNTIGFYSTGAWVRTLENHTTQGFDMDAGEESVKQAIKAYCIQHPEYQLKIFLHPRERWDKYREETEKRYAELFAPVDFILCNPQVPSSQCFEEVDLGVSFQSTIVYERLFYGFKTLLMPLGTTKYSIKESNMSNICATSHEELFDKIEKNVRLTNTDFFEVNKIRHFAKYLYN